MLIEQYISSLVRSQHGARNPLGFIDTATQAETDYKYFCQHKDTLNIHMQVMKIEVELNVMLALTSTSPYVRRWAELVIQDRK